MIFSHPLYSIILTYVPQHIAGYFYYLELGVAATGRRTQFLDYLDQIGIISGHITIIPTGVGDTSQLLVLFASKIAETEASIAVIDYYVSNSSLEIF
jgi:hypothetical protein